MSDRMLLACVKVETRLRTLPARTLATLKNEAGNDLVSTGMVIAGVLILGTALILAVKGPVSSWLNTLLGTSCLNGAASGTTPTGCP